MSRNFGLRPRDLPRPQLIGDEGWAWIKSLTAAAFLLVFMATIAALFIEFPNGLTDLGHVHFALAAAGRVITILN